MAAGGAVAAAGRIFPEIARHGDPVLLGTGVNLLVLAAAFSAARLGPRARERSA
jgi:hypothetical protein